MMFDDDDRMHEDHSTVSSTAWLQFMGKDGPRLEAKSRCTARRNSLHDQARRK